jgi:transposase
MVSPSSRRHHAAMQTTANFARLNADQLRDIVRSQLVLIEDKDRLIEDKDRLIEDKDRELLLRQAKIDKLIFELAQLKRAQFGRRSEQLPSELATVLDEAIDTDLAAVELEVKAATEAETEAETDRIAAQPAEPRTPKATPKRAPLPAHLPRTEIRHEPEATVCACGCQMKRIGEDVAERLDYTPGVFTVERHVRGKWACEQCETLTQAPVPARVIDKGIPTAQLLAQVLVAKFQDHLPLYRQESIFKRAGVAIARSTLAQWVGQCGLLLQPLVDALKTEMLTHAVLHADETPVAMLKPGLGKTHRAYLWSYSIGAHDKTRAVVYQFADSRAGKHAEEFLGAWRGTLVCDDYAGYKQLLGKGVTEAGCMAHARRKFFELHAANKSTLAGEALVYFGKLYDVEREAGAMDVEARRQLREERARPIAEDLHDWLLRHRLKVTEGSAIARAMDYSLKRWTALVRYLDDGQVPIDNNWIENQIRPIALGRKNWLFAGSQRAGERAAAVMSLIHSARLNGHDPMRYLTDVLQKLPTQRMSAVGELLPHRWRGG